MARVATRSRIQVWRDVIFAIFVREIRSNFNDKFGIAWAVISPVAFILILSFARGRLDGGTTHSMPTITFMAYGLMMLSFFTGTLTAGATCLSKYRSLFAFRQVQPISALLASMIFSLLLKIAIIFTLGLLLFFINIDIQMAHALYVILNVLSLWIMAGSIGIMFGLAESFIPEIGKLRGLLTRPLMFISGVFFSLQDMPQEFYPYLEWNPLLHAIELSRQAAYPSFGAIGVSQSYVLECTLIFLFFGAACYHISWKQAISR